MNAKAALEALESEKKTLAVQTSELAACKARLTVFKSTIGISKDCGLAPSRKIEAIIREEEQKEAELGSKIVETNAKISAYEDLIEIWESEEKPVKLRENSDMAKVEKYLISIGLCAPLDDILKNVDPSATVGKKKSLRGSLRAYARTGKIFTLGSQPDTFGLLQFQKATNSTNGGGEASP